MSARRYNKGKLMYNLISHIGLAKLAEVYTKGCEKYTIYNEDGSIKDFGADNWKSGLPFTQIMDSCKRHIQAWESGEDIDPDLKSSHLANAAWNLFTILHLSETKPEFDNRKLWYKQPLKSLWLDLDGVLVDFETHFLKTFSITSYSPTDWNDYRFRDSNAWNKLKESEDFNYDFWMGCPALIKPEDISYPIAGYCTTRSLCDNSIIELWLEANEFPKAHLINTFGKIKKSEALLALNDPNIVMCDDSIENFIDCQSNGIVCYLMSRPHNIKYDVGHWRVNNMQELMIKLKTT